MRKATLRQAQHGLGVEFHRLRCDACGPAADAPRARRPDPQGV